MSRAVSACLLVLLGAFLAAAGCAAPINADLILLNGRIETLDEEIGRVQALAARDGVVFLVGSDEEMKAYVGPREDPSMIVHCPLAPQMTPCCDGNLVNRRVEGTRPDAHTKPGGVRTERRATRPYHGGVRGHEFDPIPAVLRIAIPVTRIGCHTPSEPTDLAGSS